MRVLSKAKLQDERGAVVPIVVLSLIALFGMVVLAVDVGGLMAKRRTMVNTNDSAALAAARAYATEEGGAICGSNDGPASAAADSLAISNAGAQVQTATNVFEPNCAEQTVHVEYRIVQDLFFAPVLGFDDTTQVAAAATAEWGESSGGAVPPVELDPNLTRNCVFFDPDTGQVVKPPGPCPEGFWFNNQDLTNSGWGLMNLATWGIEADGSCNNAGGADQLGEWITGPGLKVRLEEIPTYVCTTDGGKTPNWFDDFQSQVGRIFLFPVNDPSQMIFGPPDSRQKYAIVAFAPMKLEAIYEGDSPEAIGTESACTGRFGFNAADRVVDLDTDVPTQVGGSCPTLSTGKWGATSGSVILTDPATGRRIRNGWSYDSTTHEVTWNAAVPQTADISYDWRSGGACPGHDSDPNAKCMVLSWAGRRLIGTDPEEGDGGPCLACSVRLIE